MKKITVIAAGLLLANTVSAQKYMTRSGRITFFSQTPIENIEAFNNETGAVIDLATGDVVFQVPVKSFKFEKQLMQDHFNESYMESDKYPKADFKGKLAPGTVSDKPGVYKTTVSGKLTIHGVTKDVKVPGTVTIGANEASVMAQFKVATADYKIRIPSVAEGKVAKEIEITINSSLKKM
ncbi:YceI family protein [Rurimicrobium arvi]|uniref:YceI family protein n=1 Tax=Rurimicrobium arvi TaxID=2049916 RepID=A0ABP8MLT1_9BACT